MITRSSTSVRTSTLAYVGQRVQVRPSLAVGGLYEDASIPLAPEHVCAPARTWGEVVETYTGYVRVVWDCGGTDVDWDGAGCAD